MLARSASVNRSHRTIVPSELRDPDRRVHFAITHEFTAERVLTHEDLRVEAAIEAPDGSFYLVDAIGPFLLHVDSTGRLLAPPIPFPDPDAPDRALRTRTNPCLVEVSGLRLMRAFTAEARRCGSKRPVFVPWFGLLRGNARPEEGERDDARSEIFEIRSPTTSGWPSMREAGFEVVTWTVNDKARMLHLMELGVNGIITDRPDLLVEALREFDGDGDGAPDYLLPDGRIDGARFDAQGHRGARDLRPENTLPSMEVAIDWGMTTLEFDIALTSDDVPVLDHDPDFRAAKSRRLDGSALPALVRDIPFAELQDPSRAIVSDGLVRDATQLRDLELSPVSVAFAERMGLPHPYVLPSLDQLFAFVSFYAAYYRRGEGARHPEAMRRAMTADGMRFNIEAKVDPRRPERTKSPETFVEAIGSRVVAHGLVERATLQSFDFRCPLRVLRRYPEIRTGFLFADFSFGPDRPWMAGLEWPSGEATVEPEKLRSAIAIRSLELTDDAERLIVSIEEQNGGAMSRRDTFRYDLRDQCWVGRSTPFDDARSEDA